MQSKENRFITYEGKMLLITNPDFMQSHLAKALKKWVLYVGPVYHAEGFEQYEERYDFQEARKALGNLDKQENLGTICIDGATVICDSEEECDRLYNNIVGDDGPTKTNSYNGPYKAYALTFDPSGRAMNENT
jgi:hypothetical protein